MTKDSDFKQLVRHLMASTGENYTSARAALLREDGPLDRLGDRNGDATPVVDPAPVVEPVETTHHIARAERDAVLRRVMPDGRLAMIPAKRRTRSVVLLELALRFQPGREYPEREVNELLGTVHEDVASLRRHLIEYGYLTRENSVYRLVDTLPVRDANQAQEVPAWEDELLLAHGLRPR